MRSGCRLWVAGSVMAFALYGAEPDWPRLEKHALEYFQQYVPHSVHQSARRYGRCRSVR